MTNDNTPTAAELEAYERHEWHDDRLMNPSCPFCNPSTVGRTPLEAARKALEAAELELTEIARLGITAATRAAALEHFNTTLEAYRSALHALVNA